MEVRAGIFIISIVTVAVRVLAAQIQECQNVTTGDIVFIIDSSADMDVRSFQEVRTFLRSMVRNLDVGPKKIQLGVVQSGERPQVEFGLQQHQDRKALLSAVEHIQQQRGEVQFDEVPEVVMQNSFDSEAGGRAKQRVPQVAVVLSAGGEQEGAETEARALRQQGVLVFDVGVGKKTNQQKQRSIANWPPKRFQFRADNFEKLQEQTEQLLPALCGVLEAQRKALLDRFADIVFLVDSSISSAEFNRFRNTMIQTINQHSVGASANRIALAQYGAEVNVEFELKAFQTKQEILTAARRFKLRPQPGRPTNLGSALRFAEEGLFSSGAGGRAEQGARQILVLVTGKGSDDRVVGAGRILKDAGVTVLGVGEGAATEDLNEFAHVVVDSLRVPQMKQILSEPRVEEVTHDCKGANVADIVFIVDESTSIGHNHFQLIRTFLSSIVSGLVISPDKVQVGLVSYSDEPEAQFFLNTFREKAELLQFINILPYRGGKTNTGAALNFTLENVFTEQRGSRSGVQKVAVVITEGKSQDVVSQAAIRLRRAGITVYGIGIQDFNEAEMAEMVSQPLYKHVYTVDSFSRLKPLREILQKNLCNNIIHSVMTLSRSLTDMQEACVRTDEADIFFLIDDSGSISNPDFYDMQKFVISFLNTFLIGPQNVRIGLVKFSDSPTLEFDLDTHSAASSLEKAVLKILHEGGGTETGKALSAMGPYFERAKGSRGHEVRQYLIVVTDGESTDKVKVPAEQLRAQDIIVYAIGVKDSNQTELDLISGDPKRTLIVSNFDALKSISKEVVTDICSPVACEDVPSDIIFLTDSSESIKEKDFIKMKEFIKALISRSNVSLHQVHVGLMQFSTTHRLEFDLNRYDNKPDVFKAIDAMEQMNDGTRTGRAITAVSQYFHAAAGGRPHLKQRLVVITDGESKDDVKAPAEQLRQLGVIVYAIGVEEANSTQLLEISGSLDRVFNQRNFDALKELESQLALKFCENFCKMDSVDIIFLVDVSQSSDAQQFSSVRALMRSFVNYTIVGDDLTRIGIIAYSDNAQLKFSLKGSQSKGQIYQTIDRLQPAGRRAFTGAGLEFSLDFFKKQQGGRPQSKVQVLIVLTDEPATDPEKLQPASKALRDNGVTVLSVGVRNSKKEELDIIAGGSASHVFFAKDHKEMEIMYKNMIPAICNISKPGETTTQELVLQVCDRTDLVFLLDRSSNIQPSNHRIMVDFVADVVKSFKVGESLARVAVAQFGTEPQHEFYLNIYFTEQEVIKQLGTLLYTGGGTYIGKALSFITKYFEDVHGSRRSVPRNLVIITAGDSYDSVEKEAQHLRHMGVQILVVAVRNTYDIQLERIAGSPKKLFSVADFSSLKNIKTDIVDTICYTEIAPQDDCTIDVAVGFDVSRSRRPDELLVSGRLAEVLEEVYYSMSSVDDLCCASSTPPQTNVAFYVVDAKGFPVFDTNFEGYNKEVLKKVMNHTLSQPTFFNAPLMTFYREMFKSKSSARVKVLLMFSDGLNDDVKTLERESEQLHTSGVSALLTVALDGADLNQLQSVEFGRGLLYKPPLRISMPDLGRSVLQHVTAVADRECCNVTCKCQGPDGERGVPGKQGPKGELGMKGRRGFPGDEGLMGERGPPGAPGLAGTQGCPGSRGTKGSRGFSGNRGDQGGDGLDGVDGEPGAAGLDGVRGEAGRSGYPGVSGTSGEPGPKGRSGLKGEPGDPGSDNIIQGPKGEEGPSGMPGIPGPEGRPGETGIDGYPGPNGRRGLSGEKGSPGNAGDPGLQGTTGAQGPQGPRGIDGVQGPDGEPGLPGRGGDPGPAGDPGQAGRRGSHGQKGQQGDPGIKGDSGSLGPRGLPGADGRDGAGPQGATGAKGDSGFPGYPGLPGESGLQGPEGQPGDPGTRGRNGESGKPGELGEPGGQGYPGHTGPAGRPGDKQVCPLISSIRDNCACCHGESQCPSYPTELVFGLDMSEDVTSASFDRQRSALLELLDGVSVAESNCPTGARVSVVAFSSYAKHLIHFRDYRKKQQLLDAVQKLTLEGTTNQRHLGAAMRFVGHHVFKRIRSGMTMRKVVVFFSDGPTQDPEDIVTAVMEYRALDIVPAVISLRDASEISQAMKVDDSGNSILTVLRGEDLKEELRTIKNCAICYDPCGRSEACAVAQEPLQPQQVDVDLVLVPGGFRGMQADQFTGARQLLASVVEGLEVSPEPGRADGRARVALVQRDKVEFGLQSFQKRELMRDRLLELEQRHGVSLESGQTLDLALTRVLLKAPASRRRKAMLVVESASALVDQDRLHRISLRAKCQGVALFVVTVGNGYNRTQVEDLAGLPVRQHLVHVSSLRAEQQEYTQRFFRVFLSALHNGVYSFPPQSHRAECSLLRRPQVVEEEEELSGNSKELEEEFADEATENRRRKDVKKGGHSGPRAAHLKLKTLISEDVCSLPVDRGTCAKYTVMWAFNSGTKRCSRFWYRGCGGNGNRFQTKIRCQRRCGGS